ncbi:hypothetical protein TNCV_2022161 [Trichonephila clavipes]|nr:hypothetical protein TNCV_2022161 [Trichonephila clavipes]
MVYVLGVHAATNVVELFVEIFVVLKTSPISCLWTRDLAALSIKTILVTCLSSQLLVIGGRGDPSRRSILPS